MTDTRLTVVRRLSSEIKAAVRILVVDPNPQSLGALAGFLRNHSFIHSVYERTTAGDLTRSLAENPVHLVMLEQNLGNQTGLSVIREILKSALRRKPAFMLIAGRFDDDDRREANDLGVRALLERPFDSKTLERSVLVALGATSGDIQAFQARLDQLRHLPLFAGFSDLELARLVRLCPMVQVSSGQTIYAPGQIGRSLYLLVEGQVQVFRSEPKQTVMYALLPGACFGESALVADGKRNFGARAETNAWVMEIGKSVFCEAEELIVLKLVRKIALQMLVRQPEPS